MPRGRPRKNPLPITDTVTTNSSGDVVKEVSSEITKTEDVNEMEVEVIPEKDGLFIELDVFHGEYEGVLLAEVEFPTEEDANAYTAPDWFGEDVTYSTRYHNSTMSQGWQSDYCSPRSQ